MQEEKVDIKMEGEIKLLRDVLDVLEDYFKTEGVSSSIEGEVGKAHLILGHGGLDD